MITRLRWKVDKLMEERGMTVKDLAYHAKITENTARSIERGVPTRADFPILERVAKALGVTPLALFEEYEDADSGNSLLLGIESVDYAYA